MTDNYQSGGLYMALLSSTGDNLCHGKQCQGGIRSAVFARASGQTLTPSALY